MDLTPINTSEVRPVIHASVQTNVQQCPRGIGMARESVSSFADCGPCNPVLNFFGMIGASIKTAFTSVIDFFSSCFESGSKSQPSSPFTEPDQHTQLFSPISQTTTLSQPPSRTPSAESPPTTAPPPIRIVAETNTVGEIPAELYRDLSVNAALINDSPHPLDPLLIQRMAVEANPPILIDELLTHITRVYAGVNPFATLFTDRGRPINRVTVIRFIRDLYVQFVRDRTDGAEGTPYERSVAAEIDLFLKGIIFELRNPGIPIEKKREAIRSLFSASEECPPRKHSEALRVYRVLSNQIETLEEILKQYIQMTKEDLFLNYYSLSDQSAHTLNYIRREVGAQLGLDINPINLQDTYIDIADARSPEHPYRIDTTAAQFVDVFNRIYVPSNILTNMRTVLNERIATDADFARMVSQFIHDEIRRHQAAGDVNQADLDMLPLPYQSDSTYHLTAAGVKFLLVHFGILNTTARNGHLIRQ